MLRGFLNAMDTADISGDGEECAARYLCEGAEEAAVRGGMGAAVAEVARWALHLFCPQFHPLPWQRPYHVDNTSSRPITEVTQHRAWSVLGWETASEHWVLLSLLHSRVLPRLLFFSPLPLTPLQSERRRMAQSDGPLDGRNQPRRGGQLWHRRRFGENPQRQQEVLDVRREVRRMREVARLLQGPPSTGFNNIGNRFTGSPTRLTSRVRPPEELFPGSENSHLKCYTSVLCSFNGTFHSLFMEPRKTAFDGL